MQTIPGMADLVNGRASITEFRDIELEDLLGRDSVPPRLDLIEKNTLGKNVFVSGLEDQSAQNCVGKLCCKEQIAWSWLMYANTRCIKLNMNYEILSSVKV